MNQAKFKMFIKLLITSVVLTIAKSAYNDVFTFKNVMLTCDSENPSDLFATYVTSNSLHTHLPSGQKCFKLSVEYASIPVLTRGSVSDISGVNYLLLENNNIEEIEPGAFNNLKVKDALSLKSNKIREIRRGIFNKVEVPILFLSHNLISYIDYKAFDNMTHLKSIHLDHNKLSRIDVFWFTNTPKLSKVILQHNQIQQVPRFAFQNLGTNNFGALSIDLSHNSITEVDSEALGGLRKIHFLNLAHNRIHSLDDSWTDGTEVNILDISHNRIRCLRGGLAKSYSTNFIDRNPWECGCLGSLKRKECKTFGRIVADKALQSCNLLLEQSNNCL